MNQTPIEELDFWGSRATLDDVHGVPPYDIEPVIDRVTAGGPMRCLDMGCGVGRLTNEVARRDRSMPVFGFDISKRFVFEAVRHAPRNAKFWRSDGRAIPSGITGVFDRIWSVTMFQHIPHDAQLSYIEQARDRLIDGGKLVFTVSRGDEIAPFNYPWSDADFDWLGSMLEETFGSVWMEYGDMTNWWWVTCVK